LTQDEDEEFFPASRFRAVLDILELPIGQLIVELS